MLAYAEEKVKDGIFIDIRNIVILYLLLYGLRPEDIRRLKAGDIEFKPMKIGEDDEAYEAAVIKYTSCKHGRQTVKILNREDQHLGLTLARIPRVHLRQG